MLGLIRRGVEELLWGETAGERVTVSLLCDDRGIRVAESAFVNGLTRTVGLVMALEDPERAS